MKKILIISIAILSLSACSKKVWQVTDDDTSYYRFDDRLGEKDDQTVEQMIGPYRQKLDAEMNQVIGELAHGMSKKLPESTLGNFVCQLLKDQTEVMTGESIDFALQNHGGLRISSIGKGKVTRGKIFELMPFDNMLVVITANGEIVKRLFNRISQKGGWPMSDEIRMTIENEATKSLTINGEEVDDSKMYKFAINDYIANGGDDCGFLSEANIKTLDITVRDAILAYFERTSGTLHESKITGRVKLAK